VRMLRDVTRNIPIAASTNPIEVFLSLEMVFSSSACNRNVTRNTAQQSKVGMRVFRPKVSTQLLENS
jgi:hypothetical protein